MQTLSCPVPSNINPLSPNGFKFNITKLPTIDFFCQEVNLPEITLGQATLANPFSDQPIPGDKLEFGILNVKFLIDEDMQNYTSIQNWLIGLGYPQNYEQYKNYIRQDDRNVTNELLQNLSDGVLQILNNSNNPSKTIQFRDMFPISLSTLTFLSTSQDVTYLVGDASFRLGWYEVL